MRATVFPLRKRKNCFEKLVYGKMFWPTVLVWRLVPNHKHFLTKLMQGIWLNGKKYKKTSQAAAIMLSNSLRWIVEHKTEPVKILQLLMTFLIEYVLCSLRLKYILVFKKWRHILLLLESHRTTNWCFTAATTGQV